MATKKDFFAPESTSAEKNVFVDPNLVAQTRTDGTQINEKGEVVGNAKTGSIVWKKSKKRKRRKKKEPKLNVEFDDQSFLWDHIDLFKNVASPESYLYKNFLQIKDDQPMTTKNKLSQNIKYATSNVVSQSRRKDPFRRWASHYQEFVTDPGFTPGGSY